ncbi:type II CRISPR RNA-guided endonuclease Cas9 [Trueperella pecoris]|uniref:type II CRISPR RNA-guided endonuclease Cas9 n=1 Tax=Trueperella pecoris TaxID=2733571 RepID=UPI001ABED21A|nr:type II CRISPR RNA-guided endonuclease Cas9 [Trueperella pecoris]QTG75447.1 HNH endonuclease [Trueperella pecoris]
MTQSTDFRIGVDVGTHSVGLAAIKVDKKGLPVSLLNSMVVLHDSGVDPKQAKAAITRLASSGAARRTRRLIQRRRKRLAKLDRRIQELGWPIISHEASTDPYLPWNMRYQLATEKLEGEEQLRALSIAVRHMARHRGWRSPYADVRTLLVPKPASSQFEAMKEKVTETSGVVFAEDVTPAEVVVNLGLNPANRLRSALGKKYKPGAIKEGKDVEGEEKLGVFGGKLMQSDNARELRKIGEVQELDPDLVRNLILWVFEAESPKGKAGKRAGSDALPGQHGKPRAPKAHPSFQRFRIVSVIANLRVREGGVQRPLSVEEKNAAIDLLMNGVVEDGVTWTDVAEVLGVERSQLVGTAKLAPEGERASAIPPVNTTNRRILGSGIKPLVNWWREADSAEQAAMVAALSNADDLDESDPGAEAVREFLERQPEDILEKISGISLPAGRAAYSIDSLERLTKRMFEESLDLHQARKAEFGVDDNWVPPSAPIGEPVGNPAVDRVLKIVNRWMMAIERKWGVPLSVNFEHIRSGLVSEAMVREYERELNARNERNQKVVEEARERMGIRSKMRRSDITRYLALRRQNCQCLYCGSVITFENSEMDHIVPRKGEGSTNTRDNLVAVCETCNKSKSNIPFAVWAGQQNRSGVSVDEAIERVRFFIDDSGLSKTQNLNFKADVIARLRRTEADEPIDGRSIESVAWMANELRDRVLAHYRNRGFDVKVRVFRGAITAEARKASGFEGQVQLIGGKGKTRLDRRHHAMDAAVVALLSDFVAQTLVERQSKQIAAQYERDFSNRWKEYRGADTAHRLEYGHWLNKMNRLIPLFNAALAGDKIPVVQNVRLRLGDGTAHDDTIRKFGKKAVGDSWTRDEIDQASSPQMWVALSRDPDFSEKDGLPENPERKLRVKSEWFAADDKVNILPKKIAAIPVRGGYAEVGNTIHHARLYRIPGVKKDTYGMIRVFAPDLQRYSREDLFSVQLGPETISMRDAKPATRDAVLDGRAQYLGWVVAGTELEIDLSGPSFQKNAIGQLLSDFPDTARWTLKGFPTSSKLYLRPLYLSGEGLNKVDHSVGAAKIISSSKTGWIVELGAVARAETLRVVRRDSLGQERNRCDSGLPTSYLIRG